MSGEKTIVLAFSGGLDTSYCVPYLAEAHQARVLTVFVDTGGADARAREGIAAQAHAVGAWQHREVDARQEVYDAFIATLIRGNILRGEVYPLSVAAERTQQAVEIARIAREMGAWAVAHGSTGAGNDQVRFDIALRTLLPGGRILTPIRDQGLSREAAIAYLKERALPVPEGSSRYSINAGLWGTTLGGEWTHDSWQAPPEDAWNEGIDSGDAPDEDDPLDIEIGWREGLPVSLGRRSLSGPALVEEIAGLTRPRGIGRGIHVGETVLGIKGRIGFEAGPALVLIHAHRELEKITLTHSQSFWKDHLARVFGDRLHAGQSFDPLMGDIEAMILSSQEHVQGKTRIRLERGRFLVTGVSSDRSLMDTEAARYGETHALWDGREARAFAKLSAVPALLAGGRGGR